MENHLKAYIERLSFQTADSMLSLYTSWVDIFDHRRYAVPDCCHKEAGQQATSSEDSQDVQQKFNE